jgi:hypothetical protein
MDQVVKPVALTAQSLALLLEIDGLALRDSPPSSENASDPF